MLVLASAVIAWAFWCKKYYDEVLWKNQMKYCKQSISSDFQNFTGKNPEDWLY